MKEETCMLQDEINQKEKGCLQVAARSASRTFCSAKPAGGLRHMQSAYAETHYKPDFDDIN